MRILIAHVQYSQRGGEDVVLETEARLLAEAGHEVRTLLVPSSLFWTLPRAEQLRISLGMGDHAFGRRLIGEAIDEHRPEVVHFHNLYPLLGTAAVLEAMGRGVATVCTLHNYRLSCVAGTHFRHDATCEACSPGRHAAGIRGACYRGSRLQSIAMARGLTAQWRALVRGLAPDVAICVSDFMRDRLIAFGAPADVLVVKSNSVDEGHPLPFAERDGACYVGRLSPEKGVVDLLQAWKPDHGELRIIGDGPERVAVEGRAASMGNVSYLGEATAPRVREEIRRSRVLVFPSRCYEGQPLVLLEAFAEGTPAVAFGHGAMLMLEDGQLALSGDFAGLADLAVQVAAMSEEEWTALGRQARSQARAHSHEANRAALEHAYALATARRRDRQGSC